MNWEDDSNPKNKMIVKITDSKPPLMANEIDDII